MEREDWLREPGAKLLASQIEDYWRAQGYDAVRAWVERDGPDKDRQIYCVRSNLVNGTPPRSVRRLAA